MSETVVVGAGLGGLVLAHALATRGERVRVLEAASRVGGPMCSLHRDGYLFECGPNSFIDRDPEFRALIDELGLSDSVVRANPQANKRYLVHRGRLEPLPSKPPQLLRTPLLSMAGKLRALSEPLLARRGAADESLEEFGQRHFGAEATARLLDAMQTGIYAGRIGELSAASTFPQLVALERESRSLLLGMVRARRRSTGIPRGGMASFKGGMGQLVEALAGTLGNAIELDTPVQSISPGKRWRVETARGIVEAERVVVAVHPRIASGLLRTTDASLADSLAAIPYAPMAVVHLGLPRALVSHPLDGFGFLAPAVENRSVLGCIFASSIFPDRAPPGMALLTVLVGGRSHPELVDLDDRTLLLRVRDELRALLGLRAEPERVEVVRHKLGIPQYTVGHRVRLETIAHRLEGLAGLHLCGWGYRGVGVLDVFKSASELGARLGSGL
jgi:protoporphyrinogen/coproporphyrinogen III oxidase